MSDPSHVVVSPASPLNPYQLSGFALMNILAVEVLRGTVNNSNWGVYESSFCVNILLNLHVRREEATAPRNASS